MDYKTFINTLQAAHPPSDISPLLTALWHEKKGDWEEAHQIAQDIPGLDAAWVHAYLHRVEGDTWNANYWYRQAKRKNPENDLRDEWEEIVQEFLAG